MKQCWQGTVRGCHILKTVCQALSQEFYTDDPTKFSSKFARHVNISLPFDMRKINLGGQKTRLGLYRPPVAYSKLTPLLLESAFFLFGWLVFSNYYWVYYFG